MKPGERRDEGRSLCMNHEQWKEWTEYMRICDWKKGGVILRISGSFQESGQRCKETRRLGKLSVFKM